MGIASLWEHNLTAAGWIDPNGEMVVEPSAHSVVEGHRDEILWRTALAARDMAQETVGVAIRDPQGEGRVFRAYLTPRTNWLDDMDEVAGPIAWAAGGVSALRDRPEIRVFGSNRDHAQVVREALARIDPAFSTRVEEEPAEVIWMGDGRGDYCRYLVHRDDSADPMVWAEVFIGAPSHGLATWAGRSRP